MMVLVTAAATAVAVLLADLLSRRWFVSYAVVLAGAVATGIAAGLTPLGQVRLLCGAGGCSYAYDDTARLITLVLAGLTVAALLLYQPLLRAGDAPAGETGFLIACALTGAVVLAGAGDVLTLIVALETLTVPLYALVALQHRRAGVGSAAAVTFFATSVVATAVALLGAALLYLYSGTVYLDGSLIAAAGSDQWRPIGVAGIALLFIGLGFKVAAVPLHIWAPATYDGAPLPVAAFLGTASKFAGVVAILLVTEWVPALELDRAAGLTLGALALLSLLAGTLAALRQQRIVRLLAWSSVAQAGFILIPLTGMAAGGVELGALRHAALAYALFWVFLELGAFSAVTSLRSPAADGGSLDELAGAGRAAPVRAAALAVALIGLAGLPPVLSGLFAKIAVLRALVGANLTWLAVVVALISVVGLAVYWRPLAALYRAQDGFAAAAPARLPMLAMLAATAVTLLLSVFPQLVF